MDPKSRSLYHPAILSDALNRYGAEPESAVALDGFENFIYEIQVDDQARILRIAHSLHRSSDQIEGELDWIQYLARHQVNIPRALPSRSGRLVEVIPASDGSHFSAMMFEKAAGHPPRRADWEDGLPGSLGRLLGKMNALSAGYPLPETRIQRPHLLVELDGFAERYLPRGEEKVIEKYNQLLTWMKALPTSPDVYGMVHQDAHGGNFFIEDGKITLFDFDDCLFGWYAYDVAMAFMYVLPLHCSAQDADFGMRFLSEFLGGYRQEAQISREWLARIPYFLKLREIDLYIAIHRSMDLDHLDPWCADFMRNRKANIENDIPYFLPVDEFTARLPD